jgi:hypothetical protein
MALPIVSAATSFKTIGRLFGRRKKKKKGPVAAAPQPVKAGGINLWLIIGLAVVAFILVFAFMRK